MKKRMILPFLVLSLFLFVQSCGIPNMFYLEASELSLTSSEASTTSKLILEPDSGEFTGRLMFFYFVTNENENINTIKSNLKKSLENKYIFDYNSKPVTEVTSDEKRVVSYLYDGNTFSLFQLHINTADTENNFKNNGSNWADKYMFTCGKGEYTIKYEVDSNNNLIISLSNSSSEEVLGKASTYRCNDKSFNLEEPYSDYILTESTSSYKLFILPAIVVKSPQYSNQQLKISEGYTSIELNW